MVTYNGDLHFSTNNYGNLVIYEYWYWKLYPFSNGAYLETRVKDIKE